MNGVNAGKIKTKRKGYMITLITIPPDSLLFLLNRFAGGMKERIVHWNACTWNQKLATCSKSAIVINLIRKTTYQAVHSYPVLKFSKLHRRSAKGISSLPLPLSPLPSSCQHFRWQQSPGDISPVRLNLCLCKRIRANCYIMTRCNHRDGDVWNALSGKSDLAFSLLSWSAIRRRSSFKWTYKCYLWLETVIGSRNERRCEHTCFSLNGLCPWPRCDKRRSAVWR